jgi:hypothetical protein
MHQATEVGTVTALLQAPNWLYAYVLLCKT